MARRIRKPPIKPEERREWLKLVEEEGVSPPQIAKTGSVDVRTVRKQIEMAKQEREAREARVFILRNAMELHYADLLKYIEKLNSQISGKGIVPGPDEEFIERSLRQHIPRSPIWSYLQKRKTLNLTSNEQLKSLRIIVKEALNDDQRTAPLIEAGLTRLAIVLPERLIDQLLSWAKGATRLHLIDALHVESTQEGLLDIYSGNELLGRIDGKYKKDMFNTLRNIYADMETMLKESEVYHNLEDTMSEIQVVDEKLREELAIIRLKRIVPGHCYLCPL